MPAQKRGDGGGADRIGALPDALLHHVLALLPAEDAVRTCVLARRWRHLWKSAPGLRIGCRDDYETASVTAIKRFVDCLLLHRGASPLDACELRIGDFSRYGDEDSVNLWFQNAVACKARVIKLYIERNNYVDPWLVLDDLPVVSKHLRRLELDRVQCDMRFLDFSGCPALEHLQCEDCDFTMATKISSDSLKSLSIVDCYLPEELHLQIYAPNLVSLHLDGDTIGRAPILASMPSLVEASVVTSSYSDYCYKLCFGSQDCDCDCCDTGRVGNNGGVLLKCLSEAKKLSLTSTPQALIFKRDLRWCPTFNKLKILFLNDYWCVPDHRALACILEHSPVLEKLILHLFSQEADHKFEMKGSFSSIDWPMGISEHLKTVEIKSDVLDERVFNVLKFLCTFNISFACC